MKTFVAIVSFLVAAQCQALTLVVDNLGDTDDGNYAAGNLTLREAIFLANGNPGADSITLGTAGTVSVGANDTTNPLAFGPTAFVITSDLTITGNSGGTTIDGQNQRRLFGVMSGVSLTLESLTLSGGLAVGSAGAIGWAGGAGGGAAGLGGAIFNQGMLTLRNSTLTGNVAQGGGGGRFDAAAFFGGGGGGGLGSPAPGFSTSAAGAVGGGAAGGAGASAAFGSNGSPGGAGGVGSGGGGGSQGQTNSGSSTGGVGGLGGFGGGGGGGGEGFSFASPSSAGIGGAGGGGGFGGGGGAGASGFGSTSTGGIGGSSGFGGGAGASGANSGNAGGGGGGGAGLGGAIFNHGGTVVLSNSTLAANSALGGSGGAGRVVANNGVSGSGHGGAIFNLNGTVNVTNATFSGNTAAHGGQAIYSLAHETANGITPANAAANLANSIFAETNAIAARKRGGDAGDSGIDFTGPNVVPSTISLIDGATSAGTTPINADPLLSPLANNGGPTQTHALCAAAGVPHASCTGVSPAIDKGVAVVPALTTDQRGETRPRDLPDGQFPNAAGGNGSDIGAFEVQTPPPVATITKGFAPASIALNGTSTLTLTITNPAANTVGLTGVGVSDTFPAGVQVAATPAATNTCDGTFAPAAGDTTISLTGGAIATPGNSCAVSVAVTGTTAGVKDNTTGNVTSTEGGDGGTASATLTVVEPPTITKEFAPASINRNGTSTLILTITNPATNTVGLTGVGVSDTFPAGVRVAATPAATNTCDGTFAPAAGDTTISLTGGAIATPGNSCAVSVAVTGTTTGVKDNTTGNVTSTEGGDGGTASATLTVLSVHAIPTLGGWGLALLAVVLAFVARRRLRPVAGA